MLKRLGVSSSGYYSWLKRRPSKQKLRKEKLKQKKTEIHNESMQIYGAPKITSILQSRGHVIAEKTVGNYMREDGIKVYLTSVMDLFSRKIIGWYVSDSLSTEGVIKDIQKAKSNRKLSKPVIIHSDRGCQYVSKSYLEATPVAQFIHSYSRKGTSWDNACIESFHALIKREWLNWFVIKNLIHAHQLIFEYIESFYNTVRIHSIVV